MLIGRLTAKSPRQRHVGSPRSGVIPRCHLRFSRALLCFFAFVLVFFAPARGDIQTPPKDRSRGKRQPLQERVPPPSPVDTRVRLGPGGRAEIILQATGAQGKTVEFLLRSAPAHGAFEGLPRRVGQDRVAVMYVHRAADGVGRDTFTFAAQTLGTAVSAAGTVEIDIVDNAPAAAPPAVAPDVAATPAELDFGAVEAGKSTGATLTLENRGGSPAVGRLDPPAPWTVDGDASYRLERGGRQSFRLVFRPQKEGACAETLNVEAGNGADRTAGCVVRLTGTGLGSAHPAPSPSPTAVVAAAPPAPPTSFASSSPMPVADLVPVSDARPAVRATPPAVSAPAAAAPPANEAQIAGVTVGAVGTTSVELAWKPPVPLPRSYRVERRSFAEDDNEPGHVRTDWRLYERTEFRVRADRVTATLRGLVPGEPLTVRVISVDGAGQLSEPSPDVNVTTAPASTWWRPTPLKALGLALAVCVGLIVRRRWQERQLLAELDARHAAREGDDSLRFAPK